MLIKNASELRKKLLVFESRRNTEKLVAQGISGGDKILFSSMLERKGTLHILILVVPQFLCSY